MKMLNKVEVIFLLNAIISIVVTSAIHPSYCNDCEEEIWEEVPCGTIPLTSSTSIPYPSTTPSIYSYKMVPTTPKPIEVYTTQRSYNSKLPSHDKKCYCECKVGCKDFCRQVALDKKSRKMATQLVKSSKNKNTVLEMKNLHQNGIVSNKYKSQDDYPAQKSNEYVPYRPLLEENYPNIQFPNYDSEHYETGKFLPIHNAQRHVYNQSPIDDQVSSTNLPIYQYNNNNNNNNNNNENNNDKLVNKYFMDYSNSHQPSSSFPAAIETAYSISYA